MRARSVTVKSIDEQTFRVARFSHRRPCPSHRYTEQVLASVRRDDTKKNFYKTPLVARTHARDSGRSCNAPVNVQLNRGSRRGVRLFLLLFPKRNARLHQILLGLRMNIHCTRIWTANAITLSSVIGHRRFRGRRSEWSSFGPTTSEWPRLIGGTGSSAVTSDNSLYRRYNTILSFTKRLFAAFYFSHETALAAASASSLLFS